MDFRPLFSKLNAPLEWTAAKIAAYPKATLILWAISLAVVAWGV